MQSRQQYILWVEDDEDNREMIAFFLKQVGDLVTSAATPLEALSLARAKRFDLYLFGDWYPLGKQSEFCRQVREFDWRGPILFLSAAAYQADRERAMSAGAQAYLTKPCDLDVLKKTVSSLLTDSLFASQ
jgi:DNA-binding response OmpR family regulator